MLATTTAAVRPAAARAFAGAAAARAKHTLPDLPYDYNALEPVISNKIMTLHHTKHHQAYVNNLNIAEEKLAEAQAKNDVSAQIALQGALKFNGGGHINHSLFWTNLCSPKDFDLPQGELAAAINRDYGSLDQLIAKFNAQTGTLQGSGWGWLAYNKELKRLIITTTPNQDPLEATTGSTPIVAVDAWEHAFYLQYVNDRPAYLKNVWGVINWAEAARRYEAAIKA
ncbi:Superoxide dismutase [Mn], mitochondrial [Blastocladiella emersonii ATCC 22665]|nr:Superoxide dismutase [Mn], mitochondrial [Blastocladiella emersonii ATCC 22665]